MEIDKLNNCVRSILSIFHDLNVEFVRWFFFFFLHELDGTAAKKTSRSYNGSTNMEIRNVETIVHISFSLKLFVLYIIIKAVRF